MKKTKPKKETIYRCPFCSTVPSVFVRPTMLLSKDPMKPKEVNAFVLECKGKWHHVTVMAKTRSAVIRRWNKGR